MVLVFLVIIILRLARMVRVMRPIKRRISAMSIWGRMEIITVEDGNLVGMITETEICIFVLQLETVA